MALFQLKQGENLQLNLTNPDALEVNQSWELYERTIVKLVNNNSSVATFEYPTAIDKSEMSLSGDKTVLSLNFTETKEIQGIIQIEVAIVNNQSESVVIAQTAICSVTPTLIKAEL